MELSSRSPALPLPFISTPTESVPASTTVKTDELVQLKSIVESQKNINNLIHICTVDKEGNLNCQWVQACSI